MDLNFDIDRLLSKVVEEEIGQGDSTSLALVPPDHFSSVKLISKEACCPAALLYIPLLLKKIDERLSMTLHKRDGDWVLAGESLATISGPTASLLSSERGLLNLLSHASGVATMTRCFVNAIEGTSCSILDTRKTLPGLRALEKYAVVVGGAKVHRYGLFDRLIIKIAHQKICGSLVRAIQILEKKDPTCCYEVELESLDDLEHALESRADAIILINFYPHQVETVKELLFKQAAKTKKMKKLYVESSSLITLDTVRNYAEKGVDGICIGSITHSVKAIDFSLRY